MPGAKADAKKTSASWMRWPVAGALAVLCAACARQTTIEMAVAPRSLPARKVPAPQTQAHRLNVPLPMVERVIREADVECESPEACPSNVAMLIIKEKTGLSQCTGFLIGPRTLMTNSHCLPKELRAPRASCADVTLIFPASDRGGGDASERVACDFVEYASPIGDDEGSRLAVDLERRNRPQTDFAILHLKTATSRPPLLINNKGLSPDEPLSAWTVDPVSEVNPGGTLRKKSCKPVAGSVLAPDFTGKNDGRRAPVAALSGCEILHGNSGSPLVDSRGQARALIFATLPAREMENQKFTDMSLATNLACIDPQSPDQEKCARRETRPTGPQLDRTTAAQLKLAIRAWARDEGLALARLGPLTLASADEGETDLVWGEPRCLNENLESRVEINQAPIWRVRFTVNEVYQPHVTILSRGQMTMALGPSDLGQKLNIERKATFSEPPKEPKVLDTLKTPPPPLCRGQSRPAEDSVD